MEFIDARQVVIDVSSLVPAFGDDVEVGYDVDAGIQVLSSQARYGVDDISVLNKTGCWLYSQSYSDEFLVDASHDTYHRIPVVFENVPGVDGRVAGEVYCWDFDCGMRLIARMGHFLAGHVFSLNVFSDESEDDVLYEYQCFVAAPSDGSELHGELMGAFEDIEKALADIDFSVSLEAEPSLGLL